MTSNHRDLDSYLAGVFDGEGCVSVQHRPGYYGRRVYTRLLVSVGMNSREVVEMFQSRFGGHLGTNRRIHQWYQSGSKALESLAVFADLCVLKKRQAELGMALCVLLRENRARGQRMKGVCTLTPDQDAARFAIAEEVTRLKDKPQRADA